MFVYSRPVIGEFKRTYVRKPAANVWIEKQRKTKQILDFSSSFVYNIDNKRKEVIEMTKTEMINRMIILGCIKETDRNHWMRKCKADVMKIYILIVPRRLEHLGRA